MSGQHQLHQLVDKENELLEAWQSALEKSEKDLRDYNDKQQDVLNFLATSSDVTKEIKKILERGKKEEYLIIDQYKESTEREIADLDDRYRQKELLVIKKMMENFKNKYSM